MESKWKSIEPIKMLVWDHGMGHTVERIVLFTDDEKKCIAVNIHDEDQFLDGGRFDNTIWNNFKPIPEKKYRPMTHKEFLSFIVEHYDEMVLGHIGNGENWFAHVKDWTLSNKGPSVLKYYLTSDPSRTIKCFEVEVTE